MRFFIRTLDLLSIRFLMFFKRYNLIQKICTQRINNQVDMYFCYDLLGEIEIKKNNIAKGVEYKTTSLDYIKRDKLKAWTTMELLGECIRYQLYDLYRKIYKSNLTLIKTYYLSDFYFFECFYLFVESRYEDVLAYIETHPFLKEDTDINKLIKSVKKYIAPLNNSNS